MKKNISINLFGTLYNIDEDAYQLLERYLESMKEHFRKQEGGEEIADDIEHRVAELLWAKKTEEGMEAVNIETVKEIMEKIGNPAQIDDQGDWEETSSRPGSSESNAFNENSQQHDYQYTSTWDSIKGKMKNRRLFRDGSDKVLGGVCSGLSQYLGISDPIFLRLLLVLLFLFKGFGLILYLVLWLVIPEAITPADRLRMRGLDDTPENLNQELLYGQKTAPHNGSGCLKVLFFLLILGPLIALFFFVLALFPLGLGVINGISEVTPPIAMLGSFTPWSVVCCVLLVIALLIYLAMRYFRGGNDRMSTAAVVTIILVITAATLWAIYAGTRIFTQFIDRHTGEIDQYISRNELVLNEKQQLQDEEYLEEHGFGVPINNTSRCTYSGQYVDGNKRTRYLDAYDPNENLIFTAERLDTLQPGTYRLIVLARAEEKGAFVYAITGNDTLKAEIPDYEDEGGLVWEYATSRRTAQEAGIPASKQFDESPASQKLRKAISRSHDGEGFGWSYVVIDGIRPDSTGLVTYGVSTDPELTKVVSETEWFSATDFELEKVAEK